MKMVIKWIMISRQRKKERVSDVGRKTLQGSWSKETKGSAYSSPDPTLRGKQGQSNHWQHPSDKNKPALQKKHNMMNHIVHNPYMKSLGPKYVLKSRLFEFWKWIHYIYQIFWKIPSKLLESILELNMLIFLHLNI